ncbi:MAG: hypothetical protein K2H74_06810 [Paramuribaculum sp.]|nr:hypothetical protein [Paramuribaculum sp.]
MTSPVLPVEKPATATVTFPAAIIGSLGQSEENFRKCFINIVDPSDAMIIIIDSDALEGNEAVITDAYNRGSLIAVLKPDGSVVSDWSDRNNIFYAGPDDSERCAIYGFNNSGIYYSLDEGGGLFGDEDVPLFHFSGWVNSVLGNRLKGVDLRTNDIRKRFLPQSITHTFKVSLDQQQLIDSHWATENQLSLTTTANATYTIYPIHVFDGSATGDYYAVEAEIVLHNAPMNNGEWLRRRGNEVTQMCGFYLNRCNVAASLLCNTNGTIAESTSHKFPDGATPHPLSTADATTYYPGFEWILDATVSGGIADSKDNHKLTAYNNWTWSNTAATPLPGIEIKNNSTDTDVDYTLMVNRLPGANADPTVASIPDIASSDLTFHYSWIWYVSDIDETSADRLYMQVSINPVYQAYQWIIGGKATVGEFENNVPAFKFPLTPPNRIATCSTIIRNTSPESYYISDIRFWRNKTTDREPDYVVPQTICTPSATGDSGISATMLLLPAGDYTIKGIRYSIENGQPVNECEITNTSPITLPAAGTVTIDFASPLFTTR